MADAIQLTPQIANAIESVRIQRLALHHALVYQSRMLRTRQTSMDVDCQRQTVANCEKILANAILEALDGKEST